MDNNIKPYLITVITAVALIAAWYAAVHWRLVSDLVLPPPEAVATTLVVEIGSGAWLHHIVITLAEGLLGFLYGGVCAFIFGAIFAYVRTIRIAFFPYIIAAQSFPKVAIAPLLVTWLGYELAPKVLIGALLAFFPIFLNTIAGLRDVSKNHLELMRVLQASPLQEFYYLRLPGSLTYLFPALTVAAVLSLLGAIVGEFVGATAGLGFLISQYTFQGEIAAVYAVLLVLAAVGLTLFLVLKGLERAFLKRRG